MTNEQLNKLNELENTTMDTIDKNEYSKAILGSIRDTFDGVIQCSKGEDRGVITLYELDRVSNRTENLLNLLQIFLQDSSELCDQTIKQIMELKHKAAE